MRICRLVIAICLQWLAVAQIGAAQEWPRFRGPNGSGLGVAAAIPIRWTDKDYSWKVALSGVGHSSPIVWGDRLFVTSADEQTGQRILVCLRCEDGQRLWSRDFAGERHG